MSTGSQCLRPGPIRVAARLDNELVDKAPSAALA